jgi:hypothetical protein
MMIVDLLEMSFIAIKHVDNVLLFLLFLLLMMVIIVNLWEMNFVVIKYVEYVEANDDDNNDEELVKDEFCCYQGC